MTWISGILVFVLIWWTALFAVLPIGVRPDPEGDPDTGWRGVPRKPQLLRKLLLTTLVSAVLWVGVAWIIQGDWLSFRSGWLAMPD